jgi:hypothetical protein
MLNTVACVSTLLALYELAKGPRKNNFTYAGVGLILLNNLCSMGFHLEAPLRSWSHPLSLDYLRFFRQRVQVKSIGRVDVREGMKPAFV